MYADVLKINKRIVSCLYTLFVFYGIIAFHLEEWTLILLDTQLDVQVDYFAIDYVELFQHLINPILKDGLIIRTRKICLQLITLL